MSIHSLSANTAIHKKKAAGTVRFPGKEKKNGKLIQWTKNLHPLNWFDDFKNIRITLEELDVKNR